VEGLRIAPEPLFISFSQLPGISGAYWAYSFHPHPLRHHRERRHPDHHRHPPVPPGLHRPSHRVHRHPIRRLRFCRLAEAGIRWTRRVTQVNCPPIGLGPGPRR